VIRLFLLAQIHVDHWHPLTGRDGQGHSGVPIDHESGPFIDNNVLDPADLGQRARQGCSLRWRVGPPVARVGEELFGLVRSLGGSIAAEHGVGWLKRGRLHAQWDPRAVELHEQIKHAFDPKGLMNPGKKLAR